MVDAVDRYLGLPLSNLPGMLAATGHHDQHDPATGLGSPVVSSASKEV
jgi:hypothetical protein